MSVRLTYARLCDRCMKSFDGGQVEYGADLPLLAGQSFEVVRLSPTGIQDTLVSYKDLCPKCETAIAGLVARIKLVPREREDGEDSAEDDVTPPPKKLSVAGSGTNNRRS